MCLAINLETANQIEFKTDSMTLSPSTCCHTQTLMIVIARGYMIAGSSETWGELSFNLAASLPVC